MVSLVAEEFNLDAHEDQLRKIQISAQGLSRCFPNDLLDQLPLMCDIQYVINFLPRGCVLIIMPSIRSF